MKHPRGGGRAGPLVIACANQKGGVGKTTTAVHLAVGLVRAGHAVSLADLDPQRNAILSLCPDQVGPEARADWWAWPASREVPLVSPRNAGTSLAGVPGNGPAVDYLVLDCPPTLDGWTSAALGRADHVAIPLQCEFLAMEGLAKILARVRELETGLGRQRVVHILPVMVEPASPSHHDILDDVRSHLAAALCTTWIPRDPRFPEAASFGSSLFAFDMRSVGTMAYAQFTREVRDGWS